MINKHLEQEQITRIVSKIGNGAHIFVPKEWTNEEIILIRKPKKDLKERILTVLSPYLDIIKGVYLYGSQARKESNNQSDIDLLVITSEKLKIKIPPFEIICLREKDLEKAISISPILIYSILREAKPILNSELLNKMKTTKVKTNLIKEYLKENERILNINSSILEKDTEYASEEVLYSLLLRLRGIILLKSIMRKENYSNKEFEDWMAEQIPELKSTILPS